jgi:hypothetical protein
MNETPNTALEQGTPVVVAQLWIVINERAYALETFRYDPYCARVPECLSVPKSTDRFFQIKGSFPVFLNHYLPGRASCLFPIKIKHFQRG